MIATWIFPFPGNKTKILWTIHTYSTGFLFNPYYSFNVKAPSPFWDPSSNVFFSLSNKPHEACVHFPLVFKRISGGSFRGNWVYNHKNNSVRTQMLKISFSCRSFDGTFHLACLKPIRDDCPCYLLSMDLGFKPFTIQPEFYVLQLCALVVLEEGRMGMKKCLSAHVVLVLCPFVIDSHRSSVWTN